MGISVLAHLVVLAIFLPPKLAEWVDQDDDQQDFEVTTTFDTELAEPDEAELEELAEAPIPELVEPEEEKEEPEDQEEPEEEELERPDPDVDRKVVDQRTNEEMPEEADYLSEQANTVDDETRAEETTDKNVLPGEDVPDDIEELAGGEPEPEEGDESEEEVEEVAEADKDEPDDTTQEPAPEDMARQEQETAPEVQEAPQEEGLSQPRENVTESPVVRKKNDQPSPHELFQPSAEDYEEVFGDHDRELAENLEEEPQGRKILAGWQERQEAVRASLENHITEVKPGNHTGVNAKPSVYATYINRIHRKIHARWGAGFLPHLDTNFGPGHPLNDSKLHSKLEFVIDAASGAVDSVNIVNSSGHTMYDAEAVAISYSVGPHKNPPGEIVSPDGKVYVHWNFWRDQRQCGPFGASIYIVDNMKDRGAREPSIKVQGGGR